MEFDLSARLRGDFQTTMASVALGMQWSVMTRNEGRQMLNLPSVNDGDTFLSPANMFVLDENGKVIPLTQTGANPAESNPDSSTESETEQI
jgi:hypothetical protein